MANKKPSAKELNEVAKEEISDRTLSNSIGGVTAKMLATTQERYLSVKSKQDTLKGDMSDVLTKFDDAGGHKAAFKLAVKIKNMETDKAKDFWNCLEAYMQEMGVFDQLELFADDVEVMSAAEVSAGAVGPKPVGVAQAEAYQSAHH